MSDKKRISFTGYSTYTQCPKRFDYHYNAKIRPVRQPAYFPFGAAVDVALNALLEGKDVDEATVILDEALERLLMEPTDFDRKDYDGELISETDKVYLLADCQALGYTGDNVDGLVSALFDKISNGEELSENQSHCLAMACRDSLRAKAILILNKYVSHVLPLIEEVVHVQKNVDHGIVDFVAKFKGIGLLTADNKTASRPYEPDAVKHSVQLAGYGAEKAAYIVFEKAIKKNRVRTCVECGTIAASNRVKTCAEEVDGARCAGEFADTIQPEVNLQVLIDDIPAHTQEMVKEAYADTERAVAGGHFPRNLGSCRMKWGQKVMTCPYYKLCWEGKMDGLKKKET